MKRFLWGVVHTNLFIDLTFKNVVSAIDGCVDDLGGFLCLFFVLAHRTHVSESRLID